MSTHPKQDESLLTIGTNPWLLYQETMMLGLSFMFRQRLPNHIPTYSLNFSKAELPLVVMAPGYLERPGCFANLVQKLVKRNIRVALYTPRHILASLTDMANDFGIFLDQVLTRNDCRNASIYVLGHSMGGLVVRKAMCDRWQDAPQIKHAFTLATPHQGMHVASFGVGSCANDMLPGSRFLHHLNSADEKHRDKITSIVVTPDAWVDENNGKLTGSALKCIDASGHMAILDDQRLAKLLVQHTRAR